MDDKTTLAPAKASRAGSIRWKIFLFLLGFCLLLLVILWLFQTVFLESFYTSIKLAQVEKEAGRLAALVADGDMDSFEAAIRTRGDLFVELVDETGAAYAFGGFSPEFGMGQWSDAQREALYRQTAENGGALSTRYGAEDFPDLAPPGDTQPPRPFGAADTGTRPAERKNHLGAESVLHAKIVTAPGGQQSLLLVRASVTPVNATVETLRLQLWLISGIMLVLAVGLALLIASRVARPIIGLNRAAGELGRGNYGVTFRGEGYREVAELAETLNQAARELDKTEALRRDLIANVSHDLRTPLTLITGYAEMMRDIPGENNGENMQVIIDEAKRLTSLVADLLDLSRMQSGTSELHIERFDLTDEIAGIIDRFSKFSEPEGYTVVFENTAGHVLVDADAGRISQVVYNFMINAMTHGGAGKAITVRQKQKDGRVVVEVADNGEGIPQDRLPYIWDRYYKMDATHKRGLAGSGLGLSIVKSILEQHPDMDYGVGSAKGEGSTFWFSLPLAR